MIEYYGMLKHIHMSAALLSVVLFIVRGVWMLSRPELLQLRWVKIVPHVIDTLLLISAIMLASILVSSGVPTDWLGAKLAGLVAYIVLGTIALKRGRTRGIRLAAFVGALAVFVYIVAVAFSKQPWPFG